MREIEYTTPAEGYNIGVSRRHITDEDAWNALLNRLSASYVDGTQQDVFVIIGQMLREAEYITQKPYMHRMVKDESCRKI